MAVLSNGKTLVYGARGIKIGRAGALLNAPDKVNKTMSKLEDKGDRRKVRKALRAVGRTDLSRL